MQAKDTADGSKTLFSPRYKQTLHSHKGAVTESKHVFLGESGCLERLEQGQDANVLEVGFGTGLNFFLTADAALRCKANLQYLALEQDLLDAQTIRTLSYQTYVSSELIAAYLSFREGLPRKAPHGLYTFELENVRLELLIGEATEQSLPKNQFEVIYQDAFSPDANPELWTDAFFSKLYASLKPGGVLSTYSVKGEVRRRLQTVGFNVEKRAGPVGGKREMLLAWRV